ncbi:21 kDa protein-like [Canna indica]|uniref:21 kDa protein-like n=1 Tax=Canna indica TaxID=4628 RepID=A0AAQ3QFJ0_9LILI|nr:21 kDa protein-like [Canna indica]
MAYQSKPIFPSSFSLLVFLTLIALAVNANTCAAVKPDPYGGSKTLNFIRSSCTATQYPNLCFTSLSAYAGTIQTSPRQLAHAALSVSLTTARSTVTSISKMLKGSGASSREAEAISDCMDNMADSVDELRKSLQEMGHLRGKNFKVCVNDMQTWVSSALTDENTCMEGLPASSTSMVASQRSAIRGEIVKAAQLTSNALSLINGLNGV